MKFKDINIWVIFPNWSFILNPHIEMTKNSGDIWFGLCYGTQPVVGNELFPDY